MHLHGPGIDRVWPPITKVYERMNKENGKKLYNSRS